MNRKPIACPAFYPNTFEKLDRAIQDAFKSKTGPGTLQAKRRNSTVDLFIAPCDTIEKTGPCTAWGYMDIAEAPFPETYMILGTNNQSDTKFSTYLFTDWETPFGPVKVNQEKGKELMDVFPQILNEHTAHAKEHSVEVQLPWLQFASRDKLDSLTFIPLVINTTSLKEIQKAAEVLSPFLAEHKIPLIVSQNIDDTATLQYIKSGDTGALHNYKQRKQTDLKEIAPLLLVMEIAKLQKKHATIINEQPSRIKSKEKTHYACVKFQ